MTATVNISIFHMKWQNFRPVMKGRHRFTDSMLKAKGFFGQKNYSFQTNKNLVKDFTVLGARIYQALARGDGTPPGVKLKVTTIHYLLQSGYRASELHWSHSSKKNSETVETGSRDIPIIILQSPESVYIWKKISDLQYGNGCIYRKR